MVRCEFKGSDGKRCSRKAISIVKGQKVCLKHFSVVCERISREQKAKE